MDILTSEVLKADELFADANRNITEINVTFFSQIFY